MPNGSPLLRGNRLLMGNYTMPLRAHGIICAVQTTKPFAAAIWRLPLQSSGLRMLHHSQNRLCRFHCRFAAGKPEWACCCGIITAKRLLYRAMPNGSPLARQPPFDGQLYQIYGQGDARARPACAPMADYIMSAKRHCIVYMPVGPLLGRQCCDQGAMAWTQRAVIMYISCAVPTGRFILVGQRTLNGA